MPVFDEEKQQKQLDELRKREEEDLVRVMAETKYNMPYVNLVAVPLENEALRIVPEEEARKLEVAPFKIHKHKLELGCVRGGRTFRGFATEMFRRVKFSTPFTPQIFELFTPLHPPKILMSHRELENQKIVGFIRVFESNRPFGVVEKICGKKWNRKIFVLKKL